ncbi:response regulator [Pedobacter cryophilus]|uniref:Response regulator n=1 Tax=Pedobacter cryophilus TaxID=2571271 RepID=A0A4U1BUQ5_9SPHI|nr:response regulator [Pedobacter cryophilus]TKB95982.1 response regulator [Pedobacter cryophilus]
MEQIHILLVEDNEGDILLTKEALEEAKIIIKLTVVRDGQEAIDYMNKKGNYLNAILPDLVLLDVNLPKKNGHEVLKSLKQNDDIKHIPVIMLTTSSSEKDINLAYHNYANCYITKPVEVADFLKVVSSIEDFWISLVKLPTKKLNS